MTCHYVTYAPPHESIRAAVCSPNSWTKMLFKWHLLHAIAHSRCAFHFHSHHSKFKQMLIGFHKKKYEWNPCVFRMWQPTNWMCESVLKEVNAINNNNMKILTKKFAVFSALYDVRDCTTLVRSRKKKKISNPM